MHNLYANFVKILEICKDFSKDLVNERGNLPRRGVVPRFSDLEVISLSLTAEHMSIDSENLLFDRLKDSALACMLLMEKSASCRVLPRVRPFAKMPAGKNSAKMMNAPVRYYLFFPHPPIILAASSFSLWNESMSYIR